MFFPILINVLIWLIILGIGYWLLSFIPLPPPFSTLVVIVFILLLIVVLLSLCGILNLGVPRLYRG